MTESLVAPDAPTQRLQPLDGLRGIAVLAVVALHTGGFIARRNSLLAPGGALGVDLFFVLSGFLITSLLLTEHERKGTIDFVGFYLRRFFRLVPPLLVLLIVFLIYAKLGPLSFRSSLNTAGFVLAYVFNLAKSAGVDMPPDLDHLWSLSIEEQFYLVWPIAMLGLVKLKPTVLVPVLLIAATASAIDRFMLFHSDQNLAAHIRTDARLDGLLIGATVAVLAKRGQLPQRLTRIAAVCGAVVFAALVLIPNSAFGGADGRANFLCSGGFTLATLACAAMIAAVVSGAWSDQRLLTWRPLTTIGRVSYGLYLWHVLLFYMVLRTWPSWPATLGAAVALAGTAVATAASWFLVEQPAFSLRRRLEAARARRSATSAALEPATPGTN